jgi:hypothetical protein
MAQQDGGTPIDITPMRDDTSDVATGDPAAPEGARRRWGARRIALASLLVVGLAGVGVLAAAAIPILREKDAVLDPPESVAELRRDDSADATQTAEYLRTALAAGVDLDDTVAVVYGHPADDTRSVLFFGGTALLFSPEKELDGTLDLLGDHESGASAMQKVPAGDLGGVMKCGKVAAPEGDISVCGWADHGSVAVAMFPGFAPAEAAPLMRQLRDATQTRS